MAETAPRAPRRTGEPTSLFELPDKTFRWLLQRSARSLRLPLLGALLPPVARAEAARYDEPEAGTAALEHEDLVFFVDEMGRETSLAADAVRVEVVTRGWDGFPVPVAFTRLVQERYDRLAA